MLADDLIPFFILLSFETVLEPECIKALRTDSLRVRDGASSTPGGISFDCSVDDGSPQTQPE